MRLIRWTLDPLINHIARINRVIPTRALEVFAMVRCYAARDGEGRAARKEQQGMRDGEGRLVWGVKWFVSD